MDAHKRAVKRPKTIYADGCFAYRKGFNKAFFTNRRDKTFLVQNVGINSIPHRNKVERLHGILKDMLRSRRGMDQDSRTELMLDGWFVYYNFLRPHSALNGKTPAEASGIKLDLSNRWKSLIDLATKWKGLIIINFIFIILPNCENGFYFDEMFEITHYQYKCLYDDPKVESQQLFLQNKYQK